MATARYPRLIKEIYIASRAADGSVQPLQRFNPATRFLEPAEWPESLRRVEEALAQQRGPPIQRRDGRDPDDSVSGLGRSPCARRPDAADADERARHDPGGAAAELQDASCVRVHDPRARSRLHHEELLPSLAQQQFRATSSAPDYQIAVVTARQDVVYRSNAAFSPDGTRPPTHPPISSRCGCRSSRRSPPRCEGSPPW